MKDRKSVIKRRFETIVWLAYGLLSFAWLWLHEPWRDEAQAWLIVRDLNLGGIIKQMAVEGSPALWQLLLFPLVKLGLPYFSMTILHWIFAIAAAWLLLFKSPFNKFLKLAFLFSFLIFFEYVLIARNYNLTVLLLFAIAAFYEQRFKYPVAFGILILLLFNTNIHSFAAASVIGFIYFLEVISSHRKEKKSWIAFLIMLLGGVLVFLQMPPGSSLQTHAVISVSNFNFDAAFLAICNSFLAGFPVNAMAGIVFSFVLLLFFIRFLESPKVFLFLSVSIGWLLFIFGSVRTGDLRHHGLILVFLIFSLWLEKYYPAIPLRFRSKHINLTIIKQLSFNILLICLTFTIIASFKAYRNELRSSYSGSREAAEFIRKNISPNKLIVAHQSFACSAVLPYLPGYKLWYADRQEFGTYIIWDQKFMDNAYSHANEEVMGRTKPLLISPYEGEQKERKVYFLMNSPIPDAEKRNLKLIFQNRKEVFAQRDEIFYLYETKILPF